MLKAPFHLVADHGQTIDMTVLNQAQATIVKASNGTIVPKKRSKANPKAAKLKVTRIKNSKNKDLPALLQT